MLTDSAERIFADHCTKALLDRAQEGEFPEDLWRVLQVGAGAVDPAQAVPHGSVQGRKTFDQRRLALERGLVGRDLAVGSR